MASRSNPNVPSKLKRKASRRKVQSRNSKIAITKKNRRNVLYPTSGPAAPLSAKRARKVEKALNHARKRALEAVMEVRGDLEVVMTDAPKTAEFKATKVKAGGEVENEEMEVGVGGGDNDIG